MSSVLTLLHYALYSKCDDFKQVNMMLIFLTAPVYTQH